MIDSHTHLFLCDGEESELLAAAAEAGVGRMLTVGLDEATNAVAIASAERHQGVFAAVGRHPNESNGFDDAAAADIARLGARDQVRAIGETGLDFYRDSASPEAQRRAFAAQIEIARELHLPLVIHCRDADGESAAIDEIVATIDAAGELTVILHCFSAPQRIEEAVERRWYCSFAGNVTYPKAEALREAAARVPEDRILVETDAPYLSPQSRRKGRRNAPANVVETARAVAEARGVTYEELERAVEANARALFRW